MGHPGGVVAVTALPTPEALAEVRAYLAIPRSPAEVRAWLVTSPPTLQCALGGPLLAWVAEGDGGCEIDDADALAWLLAVAEAAVAVE